MKKYIITKQGISLTVDADRDGARIIVKELASGGIFNMKLQGAEKQWLSSVLADEKEEGETVNVLGFFAVTTPEEINNVLLTMDSSEKAEIGAEGFESVEQIITISKVEDAWVVYYRKPVR